MRRFLLEAKAEETRGKAASLVCEEEYKVPGRPDQKEFIASRIQVIIIRKKTSRLYKEKAQAA